MPEQPPPSVSSGENWEWQCRKSIISSISIKPLERIYKPGYSSFLSSHIVKGKASQRFIVQIFSVNKVLRLFFNPNSIFFIRSANTAFNAHTCTTIRVVLYLRYIIQSLYLLNYSLFLFLLGVDL